jgi:hypothetical protein
MKEDNTMWIRIKGQLYNLAHARTVDCSLIKQYIMICFGSAGVVRGLDQHFHAHHDSVFIDFSEKEGDKVNDCHDVYVRILNILGLPQDDYSDFKHEKLAD